MAQRNSAGSQLKIFWTTTSQGSFMPVILIAQVHVPEAEPEGISLPE